MPLSIKALTSQESQMEPAQGEERSATSKTEQQPWPWGISCKKGSRKMREGDI